MRLSSSTGAMPSYGGGWPLELQESTATGVIDEREQALYKEALREASLPTVSFALRNLKLAGAGASTKEEAKDQAHDAPRGNTLSSSRSKLKHFVNLRRKRLGSTADIAPLPSEADRAAQDRRLACVVVRL